MATFKYFAGESELTSIVHNGGNSSPTSFSGYPEGVTPLFVVGKGWTGRVAADRVVRYKSNPSRHECDARCVNASGLVMNCECSCGGKNHGKGSSGFVCEAA